MKTPKTLKTKRKPQSVLNNNNNKLSLTVYWTMKFIISIFILYIAYIFAKKITAIIIKHVNNNISEHKKLIIHQLSDIIFYMVFGMGVLVALVNLGVQTATIITLFGTMMVTIGLALQSILSNIFAGIGVALSDNFRIGDKIRIYVPFYKGVIEGELIDLNISYVILLEQNTERIIYIPNSTVANNIVLNLSRSNNLRQN